MAAGRRGRPKKPAAILAMSGQWRAKQRAREEAKATEGEPARPREIVTPGERAEWDRLCVIVASMRVLTVADGNALARYVRTLTRWRVLDDSVREHGDIRRRKDSGGKYVTRQSAESRLLDQLGAQLLRLESHFGLTPQARASLSVSERSETKKKEPEIEDRFTEQA